jgi:hypothetical protein
LKHHDPARIVVTQKALPGFQVAEHIAEVVHVNAAVLEGGERLSGNSVARREDILLKSQAMRKRDVDLA